MFGHQKLADEKTPLLGTNSDDQNFFDGNRMPPDATRLILSELGLQDRSRFACTNKENKAITYGMKVNEDETHEDISKKYTERQPHLQSELEQCQKNMEWDQFFDKLMVNRSYKERIKHGESPESLRDMDTKTLGDLINEHPKQMTLSGCFVLGSFLFALVCPTAALSLLTAISGQLGSSLIDRTPTLVFLIFLESVSSTVKNNHLHFHAQK